MEMTRERLESYRSNVQEIGELACKLKLLEDNSKNDELQIRRRFRYAELHTRLQRENDEIEEWVLSIPDGLTRRIFSLYYLEGMSQDRVAKQLHMDRSGVSRKIKGYLNKSHKSQ